MTNQNTEHLRADLKRRANLFFNSEKELYGDAFEANDCLEDIHRIYGLKICHSVKQSIKQKSANK
jgi:hypothetical protein